MSWWEGSYEDVFADNPCFAEIIRLNDSSDLCSLDSHWNDSGTIDVWPIRSLTDLVSYITKVSSPKLSDAVKRNRNEILSGFRYAKCNMGYKDDYSGEEVHASVSSRWGVFSNKALYDADEDEWDDDNARFEKPDWKTAGFRGARPDDLAGQLELSETIRLILDHLSKNPVRLSGKKIVFIGSYDQYYYQVLKTQNGYTDEPWNTREESICLGDNFTEMDMMDWWLSRSKASICSIDDKGISKQYDYVVVRLDKWAEECINKEDILKAIAEKIPIISEYQLWKTLFYPKETDEELDSMLPRRKKTDIEKEQERIQKARLAEEKEAKRLERKSQEEAKQQRAAERAQNAEARRIAEQEKAEQKEEARKAKEAERLEAQRIADEKRAEKQAALAEARANANILYAPGEEPEKLHNRIQTLLAKLDGAYPDHMISNLGKDHKKWRETITDLYRKLGYADNQSFLEAYGFKVCSENKGGRPTTLDPETVIEELKRRYPDGTDLKMSELIAENKDLQIKTLQNNATELLGMGLGQYLKQIGILK